jgi:hypothetical protein
MAGKIRFAVSATPIETLTDENSGTHDVIAGEVLKQLGGSGESLALTAYNGAAANQGYLNATVNYKSADYTAGGAKLTNTIPDFIFIKNTGHIFSSATVLGAVSTDCIIVAFRIEQAGLMANAGWIDSSDAPAVHYIEIAWLQPGQALLLPFGSNNKSVSQFGSVAYDFTPFNLAANGVGDQGTVEVYVKTVKSDGSAATTSNAVEYLAVT